MKSTPSPFHLSCAPRVCLQYVYLTSEFSRVDRADLLKPSDPPWVQDASSSHGKPEIALNANDFVCFGIFFVFVFHISSAFPHVCVKKGLCWVSNIIPSVSSLGSSPFSTSRCLLFNENIIQQSDSRYYRSSCRRLLLCTKSSTGVMGRHSRLVTQSW